MQEARAQEAPPSALAYLGVFLVAGSVLLFEVTLTRVFAIQLWHHLTYMVVSIAMLGFGAAGSLLTARRDLLPRGGGAAVARQVARPSLAFGFAVMLSLAFVTSVRVDSLRLWQDPRNFFALLLVYVLLVIPFLLGGLAMGRALSGWTRSVHRVYFADLAGSALGGFSSVAILERIGPGETVFVAGSCAVIGGFSLALAGGVRSGARALPAALLAGFVGLSFLGGVPVLRIPAARWPIPFAPNKEVRRFDASQLAERLPSPTAEVEVSVPVELLPSMGGNFGLIDRTPVRQRIVAQDGTAPTILLIDAADIDRFAFLDDTQAGSAYVAIEAQGRRPEEVCVIGVGGGVDVLVALAHGASSIDAAEVNTAMVRMVEKRFDDELGGLFRAQGGPFSDRVRLHLAEGRSFLRHSRRRYDVIQMSGVDSFTALSTGAYTLSESYLYTVEAVRDFLAHLKEGGIVNYSRFLLTYPQRPRETLRLALIALTALEEDGVEDPASRIAVFAGSNWASTMIKKGPFTEPEIRALDDFAEREGFRGFVFDPLHPRGAPFGLPGDARYAGRKLFRDRIERFDFANGDRAERAADRLLSALDARVRGDEDGSRRLVAEAAALCDAAGRDPTPTLASLLDEAFAAGRESIERFLDVRRDFHTLLRGHPETRRQFLERYPYDLTPCTDDKPFFFNYYKWRGLFSKDAGSLASQSHYHYDYPVGHAVLLASLVQIVVIALLLLVLPLVRLRREGVATPGRFGFFAYFAALGTGFMFVEIALMQKLVLFLGHPTYALSIVLTALLGFAGIGSRIAARVDLERKTDRLRLAAACAGAVLLATLLVNLLLPRALGLPFAARVAVTLAVLLPVGLALGAPFPSGLRFVARRAPRLVPWAWAVNGLLSVFSSLFCIVLSMAFGFTATLMLAAGVYGLGFAALPRGRRG